MTSRASEVCGSLIVGGFSGETLPPRYADALRANRRGGAILFRRNIPNDVVETAAITKAIVSACAVDTPPFVGVDQEGGRVARLGRPVLSLPTMRAVGEHGSEPIAYELSLTLGQHLASLGFNVNFAPVLDVDSNPHNPVIGDRSFSSDAQRVAVMGAAFVKGLQASGVLACGKHFPGHGDTTVDSHLDLPVVDHDAERLQAVELVPFKRAIEAGMGAIMSAHVVCKGVDGKAPATLSHSVSTVLLRDHLHFGGVLFSDDLEMGAIAKHHSIGEAAVEAVRAGVDALLICTSEDNQEAAFEALVHEAEHSPAFYIRCEEAFRRNLLARKRFAPRPAPLDVLRQRGLAAPSNSVQRFLAHHGALS